jgi:hypothetical protein
MKVVPSVACVALLVLCHWGNIVGKRSRSTNLDDHKAGSSVVRCLEIDIWLVAGDIEALNGSARLNWARGDQAQSNGDQRSSGELHNESRRRDYSKSVEGLGLSVKISTREGIRRHFISRLNHIDPHPGPILAPGIPTVLLPYTWLSHLLVPDGNACPPMMRRAGRRCCSLCPHRSMTMGFKRAGAVYTCVYIDALV